MKFQEALQALKNIDSRTRLRIGYGVAALLAVAVLLSALDGKIAALERKKAAREADVAEMLKLKLRYQEAHAGSQQLANRLLATKPDDSPAKVVEETGIKGRGSQIKPIKGEDLPGYVEDAAEVKIDGVTANEAVNLLYRLEKGARPVTVKKAFIKQRFDDPAKLDVALTVALIKPAPAGGK